MREQSEEHDQGPTPVSVVADKTFDPWLTPQPKHGISICNEPVDFETAIEKAGFGKFNYLILIMMIPASWSSGFDTSSLSMVLPVAQCDLDLSNLQKGWLNSAIYIGMVSSAFFWGFVSDTYGRQKMLVIGYLLDGISSIGSSLSTSFWPMFLFKFLSGFMICGPYSIFMAYLSEVFSKKYREIVLLSAGIYFALGSILQPGLGLLLMPLKFTMDVYGLVVFNSWRTYLLLAGVPSLFAGLAAMACVESPKFLVEKGREEEALEALRTIYWLNTGHSKHSYPVKRLIVPDKRKDSLVEGKSRMFILLKMLKRQITSLFLPPHLLKSVFCFTVLTISVTSLNGVRLVLPEIFSQFGEEGSNTLCNLLSHQETVYTKTDCSKISVGSIVYVNMMWIYGLCFLCQCVLNFVSRFVHKKFILIFTCLLPATCAFFIPQIDLSLTVHLAAIYISLLNCNFYTFMSVLVLLFPTSLRATSVSVAMMFARLGSLVGNLIISDLLYSNCNLLFLLIGSLLLAVVVSYFFIPKADNEVIENSTTIKPNKDPDMA